MAEDGLILEDDRDPAAFRAASAAVFSPQAIVLNDPLLPQQWHHAAINVRPAWEDYSGRGVTVGVVDNGILATHSDLNGNYLAAAAKDYLPLVGGLPNPQLPNHGTQVAGMIAAEGNNGTGGVGVAFGSGVTSYRLLGNGGPAYGEAQAFADAQVGGIDVLNNSWSYGPGSGPGTSAQKGFFADDFKNFGVFATVEANLDSLVANGRGGLGTVVLFAAGNERAIGDNVNHHNLQNSPETIAVAATNAAGNIASFSTPGAAILVSAPGVSVLTTDHLGAYSTISGTSFSAPTVAGVAALMLEANPGLGYRDVQEILAYSARMTGNANSYDANGADNWNGGALTFSHDYGFGLVDAHAAVRLAETWVGQATAANRQSVSREESFTFGRDIPDEGVVHSSLSMPALRIDQVEAEIDFDHEFVRDLTITLTSPDGTESVLLDHPRQGQSTDGNVSNSIDDGFRFASTAHWGETEAGLWLLEIRDDTPTGTGSLDSWTLTLHGDPIGDNDVYVYTDDYASFGSRASRQTLRDTEGTDTLNAAAVSTASTIDLKPGAAGMIAGRPIKMGNGTVIEKVHGGDGGDTIKGNDADNQLFGHRGADILEGRDGTDQLHGGKGGDRLEGGKQADVLRGEQGGDKLFGQGGADFLVGGAGDDDLDGGVGADTMEGGRGRDTYVVDDAGDSVQEQANQGRDKVESSVNYGLPANVENLKLTGNEAINGIGNDLANIITGNDQENALTGLGARDTLRGMGGADRLFGGDGVDTLEGGIGRDRLFGNADGDFLHGNRGPDTLDGGTGGDVMRGGEDDDTYLVDDPGDRVLEAAGGGEDLVKSGITFTLPDQVENLTLTLSLAGEPDGTGNALANHIIGNSDANALDGKGESDHLEGKGGSDHLFGRAGADHLEGNKGSDRLEGGSGDDLLDGGRNIDVLIGGDDDDRLFGRDHDDDLRGGSGDDLLDGGFGEDSFKGGDGIDTISYSFEFADLRIDLSTGTTQLLGLLHETFRGIENARGGGGRDLIIGDDGANVLEGRSNNDTLIGSDPGGLFPASGVGSGAGGAAGAEVDLVPAAAPVGGTGTLVHGLGGANGFGEDFLAGNDDLSSTAIDITSVFADGLDFFGTTYSSLFVNNNGNVTFAAPQGTFTPPVITGDTGNPIIAPFFADVDTHNRSELGRTPGGNSQGSNLTHWDLDSAGGVLTVTWDDVGYYVSHNDKLNAFQLQIYDRDNGDFDAVFRYESVNWTTGDASGGSGGLGGTVARAGWSSGNGADFFELPQAGNQGAMLGLEGTDGNTGVRGLWVFEVRGGVIASTLDADVLDGGGGDDLLIGSPGRDQMTGGAGQDRFEYNDRGEAGDRITDFELGRAGDVLDLIDLVSFDPARDAPTDFVRLATAAGDTRVEVDPDGGANGFRAFVTLDGVTASDVDTLVADGNLVLA